MHKKTIRYIAYLAFVGMVPPLSTDMYLAAVPDIARQWGVSSELVTHTITLWFVSFSIGLLFSGPLSDKYGRRPTLLLGLSGFVLSCILCAAAAGPYMLIFCRILQGVSASAPSAMAMAICRDRFDGNTRKIALAYIGIMMSLAPILAPPIGSVILWFADWRFIFICQAASGLIMLLMTLKYTETNKSLLNQPLTRLLGRYLVLFRNRGYLLTTLTLGMLSGPFYSNVAFSPIVYLDIFKQNNFIFSLLFALTASCSIVGAYLFTRINGRICDTKIISLCLFGVAVAGVIVLGGGKLSFMVYFAGASIIAFFTGMSRPVSNHLVLGFVENDIGSASSFMIFYQFIFGALCMSFSSYSWESFFPVSMFGIMTILVALVSLFIWQRVKKMAQKIC